MTKQKLIDLFINSQENLNPRTYKRHGIKFELDQNGEFLLEIKSQSASYTYGFYSVEDEIFGIDHGSFFKEDSLNADKLNFLVETSKQKIEYHQTIKNGFKEIEINLSKAEEEVVSKNQLLFLSNYHRFLQRESKSKQELSEAIGSAFNKIKDSFPSLLVPELAVALNTINQRLAINPEELIDKKEIKDIACSKTSQTNDVNIGDAPRNNPKNLGSKKLASNADFRGKL